MKHVIETDKRNIYFDYWHGFFENARIILCHPL